MLGILMSKSLALENALSGMTAGLPNVILQVCLFYHFKSEIQIHRFLLCIIYFNSENQDTTSKLNTANKYTQPNSLFYMTFAGY